MGMGTHLSVAPLNPSPFPQPPAAALLYSVSDHLATLGVSWEKSPTLQCLVTGRFTWRDVLQLLHGAACGRVSFFLRLNHIPLGVYAPFW